MSPVYRGPSVHPSSWQLCVMQMFNIISVSLGSREDGSTSVWGGTRQRPLEPPTLYLPDPPAARSPRGLRHKWTGTWLVCSTPPTPPPSSSPALFVPGSTYFSSSDQLPQALTPPLSEGTAQELISDTRVGLDSRLWMNVTPWSTRFPGSLHTWTKQTREAQEHFKKDGCGGRRVSQWVHVFVLMRRRRLGGFFGDLAIASILLYNILWKP